MNIYHRYFLFVILTSFFNKSVGQNDEDLYQKIESIGLSYVNQLKEGNIEGLKNINPPKDTWLYSKLLDYKKHLDENENSIFYGSFIEPSIIESDTYAYNFFALKKQKEVHYFFVAVISVSFKYGKLKIDNTYLFTEDKSLKGWWQHVFSFYESEAIKTIPKKYLYKICPPPPFKE
jgi:hypothetical protein